MSTRLAQPTRPVVGKEVAERQHIGGQPHAKTAGAPPGRRVLAVLGLASLLLLGACGSGGGGVSVRCSGPNCTATVSAAPIEVEEPGTSSTQTVRRNGTTTKTTTRRDGDVDFRVVAMGPGWVDVVDDGQFRLPVGSEFPEDDSRVRLASSDGRTAVFTWGR
ncbi:hypothetical protein [Actinomycetospora termitidis]|uniref:Uncharacterized protein n=1 Tax=Actinomycetospora termitidis TaxID=3053470 RepID=A0ABT7MBQ7_9PSEU|nr:hypothetical protein [Actinomycetospora sp. Odt1-22]MDL5158095.1 hypothetical protein [Actinomycetospora sp. Odt1-22]